MRCMMAGALPLLGIVGARASMLAVVAAHAARAVVSLMKRVCDGTTLEQQLYNLPLVVLCRLHVGRLALLVRQLRVGLGLQQLVDGVRVAHAGGAGETDGIHVAPKNRRCLAHATLIGLVNRKLAELIRCGCVGLVRQKDLDDLEMAMPRCEMESSWREVAALEAHVGAASQQRVRRRRRVRHGGRVQRRPALGVHVFQLLTELRGLGEPRHDRLRIVAPSQVPQGRLTWHLAPRTFPMLSVLPLEAAGRPVCVQGLEVHGR
mmetsp:Transcript_54510/g.159150  ORF Transcript_54510/g.159150 Transcript_54510/m.159150 type:complete len:262 (-) Transcript_54510:29-814(-)